MVLTASKMLPLGTKAPDFTLVDTITDTPMSLQELKSSKATVIMFLCNHCPYVLHILEPLIEFIKKYQQQGIVFIAINSNDAHTYPQDAPNKMRELATKYGFTFPFLFDETQKIAKSYHAACTPDFYLFDKELACVYRGQFDDSSPGKNIATTGESLGHALDCLLAGKPIDENQKPSMGCNIKWKS